MIFNGSMYSIIVDEINSGCSKSKKKVYISFGTFTQIYKYDYEINRRFVIDNVCNTTPWFIIIKNFYFIYLTIDKYLYGTLIIKKYFLIATQA